MKLSKHDIHQRQRTKSGILEESEVARIKWLLAGGSSRKEVAQAYQMSLAAISAIARGDTWSWVTAASPTDLEASRPLVPISADVIAASQTRLLKMLESEGVSPLTSLSDDQSNSTVSDIALRFADDLALAKVTADRRKLLDNELDSLMIKGDLK
jgi:hypothetical protein